MVTERENKGSTRKEPVSTKADLAGSEAGCHMLVENFSDNILIHDLDGKILFTNKSRVGVLGAISPEEIIGRNAMEFVHPEDREMVKAVIEDAVESYKNGDDSRRVVEHRMLHLDGTEFYAEATGIVFLYKGELAIQTVVMDTTSRMQTEAELKKSLQRHQALFDNMLSGAAYHKAVFDSTGAPIDYIFLEINDAFEKNTGLKRENVVGKPATEVIPGIKDLKPDLIKLYGTVASTGKGRTFDLFYPPLKKWFAVSAYCPEKGFSVATFFDITERKRCEIDLQQANVELEKTVEARTERLSEANLLLGREVVERKKTGVKLKEADDRFRTIFESSNYATLLFGSDGFIDLNRAALSVFGCARRDELLGSKPEDWSPAKQPDGRDSIEAAKSELAAALANGHNFFEWVFERVDGELFPAEVLLTPMSIDGRSVVHITIRDITVRRNLEDETMALHSQLLQSQKMEAIGTLAGGIAHDFNNILTVVKSLGTLVLTKIESGSRIREYIETLLRASERGTSLVQQLLIFSQSKPCEMVRLDLNDSINDLLVMLRSLIDEDITIEERLVSEVCEIEGDRGRIEQLITNLILNCSDALPQGGDILISTGNVTIPGQRASGKGEEKPGEYICMTIEDNGVGMDVETVEHIFEPFFTTKSPNGTGLGLSVVYGILKDMNGWIDVQSTPGSGSIFSVYLPRSKGDLDIGGLDAQTGSTTPEPSPKHEPADGQGRRVLLVEDDMWVRKSTAMALAENGYTVLEARDAKDALNLFRVEKGRFDIVISDVVMPGMDGLQMMEALLAVNPDTSVFFYSGHIDDKAQLDSIIKKGFPFLQKPYEIVDLLRAVEDGIGSERE